jgi:hypothetical protein
MVSEQKYGNIYQEKRRKKLKIKNKIIVKPDNEMQIKIDE